MFKQHLIKRSLDVNSRHNTCNNKAAEAADYDRSQS
jgi:hypothetical protein